MKINEEEYLAHYGILRRSGRYPWGTSGWGEGAEPKSFPRNMTFIQTIDYLKSKGLDDATIAKGFGITQSQYRTLRSVARAEERAARTAEAKRLKDKGMSNSAAARQMGIPEATFRTLLVPSTNQKLKVIQSTANMLKEEVDKKGFIDIGSGVEAHLQMSKEQLNNALTLLREEGYEVHTVPVPQLGTTHETNVKVLTLPGNTQRDVFVNRDKIRQISRISDDGGETFFKTDHPPISVDPSRVSVSYAEDGGDKADGVIFVRPGKDDLSLGGKPYGQVRIKIGEDHYLKGMAVYKDDLPEGVDLLFNTNKSDTGNMFDAMKPISSEDLPFGSVVRQIVANPGTPQERVTSAMNIVGVKEGSGVEGSWDDWSRNISAQALSKQSPTLAKRQLDLTYQARKNEYDEIMALTNPTIKRKLLEEFADSTDASSVHLKAAAFERQNWNVILPVNSLKDNEIYAPTYHNGEEVALIRYPHGGTFEIPILKVNNRNREGGKLIGSQARDAVGINYRVAERLSGADFDGDTVLVIPTRHTPIKSTPPLEGLEGFNPKAEYPAYEGMPKITPNRKQQLMGDVSNLITDMTIQGAPHSDIVRAVRHSMVVIDAEKHNLNYKLSEQQNGIRDLKAKYQGRADAGASTLISKGPAKTYVRERQLRPARDGGPYDPETGRKVFVETGRVRTTKDGAKVPKLQKVRRLELTDDAHTLSSGTRMEKIYADHSNKLKNLANEARLSMLKTPPLKYSPSAKRAYESEVASLDSKLALSNRNKPLERQAQVVANTSFRKLKQANPDLSKDRAKKLKYQELEKARTRLGAKKYNIKITPKEWEAIQAGAISNNKLEQILRNTDTDLVRKYATPRPERLMTAAKTARAQSMLARGFTRAEVARQLGVSVSTLDLATVEDAEDWGD